MRVRRGGDGQPVLLLLHGLGATSDVWRGWLPLLDSSWPGRWIAPDLPGHGGTPPLTHYSFEALAAAVADLARRDDQVIVLGHSMGGVVGLALAGFRPVEAVIGLGIKVEWTAEELAKARALGDRPVSWFPSRDEAAARHLRVSGLAGLLDPGDPAVDPALWQEDGRWRLALDPRAFAVGAPDMPALLAATRAPVVLARGEHDPMVSEAQLARLAAPTVRLPGLGHNAHVEDPASVYALLDPFR